MNETESKKPISQTAIAELYWRDDVGEDLSFQWRCPSCEEINERDGEPDIGYIAICSQCKYPVVISQVHAGPLSDHGNTAQ